MIYDKLENLNKYGFNLSFIKKNLDENIFLNGKCEINGNEEFCIGLEYETKNEEDTLWEAHRKYLDIHVILEGEEFINITDIQKMKSIKEYEEDYELFQGEKEQSIHLYPGYFLLLFPHEVHRTSIAVNEFKKIRKKVFKKNIND